MSKDLEGVTVVSVEQAVAAPYASCQLADAGARVIKVERPEGDFARDYDRTVHGQSAYFIWINRGKQSIQLNLKDPGDQRLLRTMVGAADIFIQNLRPDLLASLGFGSERLRAEHTRLITCDITGFGHTGPRAHLKAYDLIVQAESGLCAVTGDAAGPARVGVSVCDIAAGMTAHAAILQALFARERTGAGRSIQVSLFDSLANWMNVPLLQYLYGDHVVQRAGVEHPTIAPYGAFGCKDDVRIIISIQNEREWIAFCRDFLRQPNLARDPRFSDNPARVAHRAALNAIVSETFATLTSAEAISRLEASAIAYGRLNSVEQAAVHPHLRFVSVTTPRGEVRVIAPAAITDGQAPRFRPVPELGEHNSVLRTEFK